MERNTIAGFMMGVGVGVAIGYFLKPSEEDAQLAARQQSEPGKRPADTSVPINSPLSAAPASAEARPLR